MKAQCPYCGYEEEMSDDDYGKAVECPCGQSFVVGQVRVSETAFENGNAVVRCPYCKAENSLPKEAIGRNVRCGKCNGKFCVSIKDIQVASRGGKIKMGSRENSAKKVCARNTKMQKPFYDYLNLDACQSAADALLVCSILACIGWAIYAFSIAKTFDLWVIVVAGALPVFAAVSIYVLLASIVAVFEIAKNLRQLCTEVSQLRQEK